MSDDTNIPLSPDQLALAIQVPAVGINQYMLQVLDGEGTMKLTFCEGNGTTTIVRTAVVLGRGTAQQLALALTSALRDLAAAATSVQISGGDPSKLN